MMALEASEFGPEDIISTMPDSVVTNILQRLPLQDAVRTGILSRNWRFKWTMLSQLIFDTNFFAHLIERRGENTFGMIISRLLLHLNSAITKSVLVLTVLDVVDIHHLILFLSEKGIKDLTLTNWCKPQVKLPTHLFSCLELKHLNISGCCFNPPPSFRGFPNLLSLELCNVQFGGDLGEFLTQCPLLESLDLGYLSYPGNLKPAEIAKLENLKILSLSLCHLETTATTSSCDVFELVGYLPKLQELGLDFHDYKVDDPVPVSIPILEVEYNTMELRSVVFNDFKDSENEVYLLKYFLACSPYLKKIVIHPDWSLAFGEQFMLAKKLLKLHCASPIAEIHFD